MASLQGRRLLEAPDHVVGRGGQSELPPDVTRQEGSLIRHRNLIRGNLRQTQMKALSTKQLNCTQKHHFQETQGKAKYFNLKRRVKQHMTWDFLLL